MKKVTTLVHFNRSLLADNHLKFFARGFEYFCQNFTIASFSFCLHCMQAEDSDWDERRADSSNLSALFHHGGQFVIVLRML